MVTRRLAVQLMLAGGDFWNRRPAAEWSADDIERLLHNSPWAKDVNADFYSDTEVSSPSITRGGVVGPPTGATHRRQPATVVWESGQPLLDAKRSVLLPQWAGRYVLSVGELPMGAMDRRREPDPNETPLERRNRMLPQLSASATLEARGKPPVQAGVVEAAPRAPATWLFGFSRELLDIDRDDREVTFSLQTAFITLRAKFEPAKMIYRGKLAI